MALFYFMISILFGKMDVYALGGWKSGRLLKHVILILKQ